MEGTILKLADGQPVAETPRRQSYYREDLAAKYLLVRTDESGNPAYFVRIHLTGLHARVFGPFRRKSAAIQAYDSFLQKVLEAFCDFNAAGDLGGNGREHVALPDGLREVEGGTR